MIEIDGKKINWESGMTLEKVLQENGICFSREVVLIMVNNLFIPNEAYATCNINDEDEICVMRIICGG